MIASVRRMRMISQVFLSLLVSLLMLALVWLYQHSGSHHGPFTSQAARRSLPPISSHDPRWIVLRAALLLLFIGWGTSSCSCATLEGDQKPAGSVQTHVDRKVCLSQ